MYIDRYVYVFTPTFMVGFFTPAQQLFSSTVTPTLFKHKRVCGFSAVVKPVQVITSGSRPGGLTRTDHRLPQAEAGLPINEACSAVPFLTPAPQPTAPPDPRRRRVSQLAGELRTVIHGFAFLRFARSFAPGPDDNVAARGIPSVNPP